jgi:hypothetical protein
MVRKISIFKRALLSSSSMELGVVFFFFFEEEDRELLLFAPPVPVPCGLFFAFRRFGQKKKTRRADDTRRRLFLEGKSERKFFSFLFLRLLFQLNWRLFDREIDILRPDKNVRTVNEKASAKFNFSNALSFAENDQQ